ISRSFYKLGMSISDEDALYISKRCRNNPRIANNTVKRISDKALVRYAQQNNLVNNGAFSTVENIRKLNIRITQNVIDVFFEENGIDEYGLEKGDRDLLRIIITRYGGGPVGIDTLSRVMNESNNVIAQKYESYLVKKGFLKIERDGRVIMPEAYKVLGLPVPIAEKTENTASSTEREEIKSKYDTRKIVAALVQDELKCAKLEELICYPESVKERGETLDELFPDIEKGYEGENETKHLCKNEIDFDTFKRTLICDSFLESRFASCMASVGFLKDIKAQTVELPYISQELNNRRYFPDFVIKDYKSRIAVIEMKNFEMMSYHLNIDKYETLKAYCEKNGYGYAEIMKAYNSDKYVSVEQIKNAPVNEALSKYVYETIEKNGADSGEGIFTDENLAEYKMNNPNTGDTDIYTLLLSDRRLKNVDRTGTNIRIIKN
ncbi:hypothetical protein EOM82_08375, partial [bacterium]|nr:hypothetical protein [bacterium]